MVVESLDSEHSLRFVTCCVTLASFLPSLASTTLSKHGKGDATVLNSQLLEGCHQSIHTVKRTLKLECAEYIVRVIQSSLAPSEDLCLPQGNHLE